MSHNKNCYTTSMKSFVNIGIDEVGRGPLAGPVMVCAFASYTTTKELLSLFPKKILKDSKKLTEKEREKIYTSLLILKKEKKVLWKIAKKEALAIDTIGINPSITRCITKTLDSLVKDLERQSVHKDALRIFLDGGLRAPTIYTKQKTIIRGDEKQIEIACASIIAKVTRDALMRQQEKVFPGYGFEHHVGYGTKIHREAIVNLGITPLHRKTFLKKLLDKK